MKKLFFVLLLYIMAPVILHGLVTSPVGIALIKHYEGLRLSAYRCPADAWTIGYGHTGGVRPGMRITERQATSFLRLDIRKFERYILRVIPRLLNWYEFDALVSFTYNLGYRLKGGLRDGIVSGDTDLVSKKIKLYNKARVKGRLTVLRGLVRRRNDEANLYQKNLHELDFFDIGKIPLQQLREAVWRD
jgi:lysozyme